MKRILHVIDTLGIGGAEKLLSNTISEQGEYEHLVVTVFPSENALSLPLGIKHICLETKGFLFLAFKGKEFKKIVKEFQPDIVHAHLYFATILAKAFTPLKVPLVFTQHFEFSKNIGKWYYAVIDRIISRKTHHVIAVSNTVLKDYVRVTSFKGQKHIINNYIPDIFFQQQALTELPASSALKLVSVGNLKPIKNQQYLIDAFMFLKDLPVCCDVYGSGPQLKDLQAIADLNDLRITFKGSIPDSSKILADYHMFIMPSLTEGFPLALFEAMATGLTIAVSDIPVFHEVLQNEGNYFSLIDPKEVRVIVENYLQSPKLLRQDGARMRQLAASKASKEVYLKKLCDLYLLMNQSSFK